jgi:hypothetical protein
MRKLLLSLIFVIQGHYITGFFFTQRAGVGSFLRKTSPKFGTPPHTVERKIF